VGHWGTYQPRRANERECLRDLEANFVEIVHSGGLFVWFRQRILQYGSSVQILRPEWLAQQVAQDCSGQTQFMHGKRINWQRLQLPQLISLLVGEPDGFFGEPTKLSARF
jgi:hypothetical protein